MRQSILLVISILCLSFVTVVSQGTPAPKSANDRVIIRPRRIVIVRSPQLVKQFPHRKRAVVTYPLISGLSDPVVLRRVRALFDFKNIFDYSLQEYREDAWLSEFGYVVNYNANYLLDITFTQSGVAAYPDEQSKHFLINLRDGSIVKAADVFLPDKMNQLVAYANRQLQREIDYLRKQNSDPGDAEAVNDAYEQLKFELKDLDDFSVDAKGVTFHYDAGFPHVIKALEPRGRYFLPHESLRLLIRRDGPLWQFVD